jgi:hypothetical protein
MFRDESDMMVWGIAMTAALFSARGARDAAQLADDAIEELLKRVPAPTKPTPGSTIKSKPSAGLVAAVRGWFA